MKPAIEAAVICLVLSACSVQQVETQGFWHLESFTVDGKQETVVIGENTAEQPWIEMEEGTFNGVAGCNGFRSNRDTPYTFEDGVLTPGEVFFELALCLSDRGDPMRVEEAFIRLFWENPDGIEVHLSGDLMTWSAADTQLLFARADGAPPEPTPPRFQRVGRLDCAPGLVAEDWILDTGQGPEAVARAASPDFVRLEQAKPLKWWGYDKEGKVVVGLALGDVDNPDYQVWTCEDSG